MKKEEVFVIKKELLGVLSGIKQDALNEIQKHSDRVKQEAIEAPGGMQSRYDSSKQELGYLVDSLENRISQLKRDIAILKSQKIDNDSKEKVDICALVEIEERQKSDFYFISSAGGGEKIKNHFLGKEIKIISPSSPIGAVLMGRVAGESVFLGQRTLTIISVF